MKLKHLTLSILAALLLVIAVLAAPQYEEAIRDGHRPCKGCSP